VVRAPRLLAEDPADFRNAGRAAVADAPGDRGLCVLHRHVPTCPQLQALTGDPEIMRNLQHGSLSRPDIPARTSMFRLSPILVSMVPKHEDAARVPGKMG